MAVGYLLSLWILLHVIEQKCIHNRGARVLKSLHDRVVYVAIAKRVAAEDKGRGRLP